MKGKRHNPAAAAAARLQFAPGRTRRTTPDSFAVSEGANERASSSVGFFFFSLLLRYGPKQTVCRALAWDVVLGGLKSST